MADMHVLKIGKIDIYFIYNFSICVISHWNDVWELFMETEKKSIQPTKNSRVRRRSNNNNNNNNRNIKEKLVWVEKHSSNNEI